MLVKLLMVEDNEGDAYLFRRFLQAGPAQYDITTVLRASEAVRVVEQAEFDVILLDLTLPDSCGLETLTTVRAANATTPIVLLTGIADEELAISCLRNGAQDYLAKQNINEEVLARTIRHAMERMRVERALMQSESELRALFKHAPHGIYRSAADGNLLDVNEAFVSMLGWDTKDQVLELNLTSDVYVDAAEHERQIETRLSAGSIAEEQVVWKRRDDKRITVRLSGRVVRADDGSLKCFEVFAEDVTERLALEEQLRQTQKMEAVGQLAGGVAHEINNLLSIILADAELIQRALPSEREDLVRDVEEVRQVAISGGKLVKRLLGFSRRQRLSEDVVELGDLVAETVEMLRRLLPEFVQIEFEAAGPQACIRIDPATVEQILLNLTTNSRDAMPNGGKLTISTGSTVLDDQYALGHPGARPGPVAYLRVSDTGMGMDEETLRCIFEPFFSTKPRGKGTGLGMSTVYGLVKQQAGYIWIESEPGVGSTIEIFFPRVDEASKTQWRVSGPANRPEGTETILVVEDEAELRRAARRALERFGYTVILAADGVEGLDRYREHYGKIDLVLSDVVMPNMGGPAFVERMMAEAGDDLPAIIFVSGYTSGDLRNGDLLDGRYTLLEKPWELATLLRTVRGVLDAREPSLICGAEGGHATGQAFVRGKIGESPQNAEQGPDGGRLREIA